MPVTIYGIPNCDTVKRTKAWFDARGIAYSFHDYKKHGVPEHRLRAWIAVLGWEVLLNRRGTTFRKLEVPDREVADSDKALRIMLAHPSLIKRPVVETDAALPVVGFNPDVWMATVIKTG